MMGLHLRISGSVQYLRGQRFPHKQKERNLNFSKSYRIIYQNLLQLSRKYEAPFHPRPRTGVSGRDTQRWSSRRN